MYKLLKYANDGTGDYDDELSYILNFGKGKTSELYNLKDDPQEKNNLVDDNMQKAMELELDLRRFVAGLR